MKSLFSPKFLLWGGGALLLATAVFLSFLIQKRQDELSRASTYDLSWTAGQTVVEVARLGHAVAGYTVSPQLVPRREVEMRLELFLSRAELTNGSFFRDLSASDPACAHAVEQLRLA